MSLKYEVTFDDTTGLPPKVKVVAIACAFTAHSIPKNFMACPFDMSLESTCSRRLGRRLRDGEIVSGIDEDRRIPVRYRPHERRTRGAFHDSDYEFNILLALVQARGRIVGADALIEDEARYFYAALALGAILAAVMFRAFRRIERLGNELEGLTTKVLHNQSRVFGDIGIEAGTIVSDERTMQ